MAYRSAALDALVPLVKGFGDPNSPLVKGLSSGDITAVVPQDLEIVAHNTTWSPESPYELNFLKSIPSTQATSVTHEYDRFNSYSNRRVVFGTFPERGLPVSSRFEADRHSVSLRVLGQTSDVTIVAAQEQTINVNGASGAVNIQQNALQTQVLGLKQSAFLFSRTDTVRGGASSSRIRGLIQAIQEGTDGTDGPESPIGSHVIDLEGAPLTQGVIRDYATSIIEQFGAPNCFYMAPGARADLEASLDGSYFLPMPLSDAPYALGQQVRGFSTQGADIGFITDNMLQPNHPLSTRGRYSIVLDEQAPQGIPTINSCTVAPASGSKFDAASAGDLWWFVTETVNELESLGRRFPAGSAYQAVAVGDGATFSVTPQQVQADSFRVYRGKNGVDTNTDGTDQRPYFAFEVANSGGGSAVTFVDKNLDRPNTTTAFMLSVNSNAQRAMANTRSYTDLVKQAGGFIGQPDNELTNTVSIVHLGPQMWKVDLAAILATAARPLIGSIFTSQVRQPRKNIVFKNVGRAS